MIKKNLKYSVCIFIFAFTASVFAGINWGPYLTWPTQEGIVVQFGKDFLDVAEIRWDDSASYISSGSFSNSANSSELDTRADFTIRGYSPGTKIYYQIIADDEESPIYSFRTNPELGSSVDFTVYGDNRTGEAIHTQICQLFHRYSPEFIINTGDLGDATWDIGDWDMYFRATDTISPYVPIVSTIGNHELPYSVYLYLFTLPNNEQWYTMHFGCVSVLCVNLYADYTSGSEQYNWIRATLTDSIPESTRWIIINEHESPYSTSNHGSNLLVRSILKPLYDSLGVDVVVCGHDHCYEHSLVGGIHYFVSGGGGAPLYSVSGGDYTIFCERTYNFMVGHADSSDLCFSVHREDNSLIEEFCLSDYMVSVTENDFPYQYRLTAYPNPFNRMVKIRLPEKTNHTKIDIYDIHGNLIKQLSFQPNIEYLIWEPDNSVPDGIYFVSYKNSIGERLSQKLIYLK